MGCRGSRHLAESNVVHAMTAVLLASDSAGYVAVTHSCHQ
jgi:hypothetical protein